MAASPAPSTASESTRLFLALWPDAAQRTELARRRDEWQWPRAAAPVPGERLHLTLHFLGALDAARVAPLVPALALPFSPFVLRFGVPALWHAGIAVLEPLSAPPALLDLQERLGMALGAAGIATEARPYRPHVTLARRAGKAGVPPISECQFDWQVGSYALVASRAGTYSVLQSYPANG